ncbi:MAG: ATP-dependent DNA helicase RecQ [Planctomycetota bacterium]
MHSALPDHHDERVRQQLLSTFGHDLLRAGQQRALAPILDGQDTIVVMPTGSGKSLCFQLPAMIDEGLTLVISPLISLMKDQVDGLRALGVAARAWNSQLSREESSQVWNELLSGELKFLYLAPERLGSSSFLNAIENLTIRYVAIDEAHCVSQWGHDFRPDYLKIASFLDHIGRPQTLALTATATPNVREDIARQLKLREPAVIVTGFDRPNLSFAVTKCRSNSERSAQLSRELKAAPPNGATIIYVGSRKNAESVSKDLNEQGMICGCYHAGLPTADREREQDRFMSGAIDLIVATNAFGMGIDRPDVRLVVHWDLPGSLEAYYQEAGRAGRDGEESRAVILFSEASLRLHEYFHSIAHPPDEFVLRTFHYFRESQECGEVETRDTIRERGADNREANLLGAGLNRLQVLGFLSRTQHEGVVELVRDDADALISALADPAFQQRAESDRRKLDAVAAYARRRRCRRNALLAWFEALEDTESCGRCDVCTSHEGEGRNLDDSETELLRKVLSGIARARGYAGRNKIALMLIGSAAKEVQGTWLQNLSTFGLLPELNKAGSLAWIDAAADSGLAEVSGDRYPVLAISTLGIKVLKSEVVPPTFGWPAPKSTRSLRKSTAQRNGSSPDSVVILDAVGERLNEKLRAYRSETALAVGQPAYIVFPDRTLRDLLEKRPRSDDELEEIHGFGPARRERYGPSILAIIDEEDG